MFEEDMINLQDRDTVRRLIPDISVMKWDKNGKGTNVSLVNEFLEIYDKCSDYEKYIVFWSIYSADYIRMSEDDQKKVAIVSDRRDNERE